MYKPLSGTACEVSTIVRNGEFYLKKNCLCDDNDSRDSVAIPHKGQGLHIHVGMGLDHIVPRDQ